jgi:hypothetical protein
MENIRRSFDNHYIGLALLLTITMTASGTGLGQELLQSMGSAIAGHPSRDVTHARLAQSRAPVMEYLQPASVESKNSTSPTSITKLDGTVTSHNVEDRTLTIGQLTVSYANNANVVPAVSEIAVGKRVSVFSSSGIQANGLSARTIVVRELATSTRQAARVAGRIHHVDVVARHFVLDGVNVNASTAAFVNGSTEDLSNGRKLKVIGAFSNNELIATEIRFAKEPGDSSQAITNNSNDVAIAAVSSRSPSTGPRS